MPRTPTVDPATWIDQDLSAAAAEGRLHRAYECDDVLLQLEELLAANPARSPVLVGSPGTGKTAILHELLRRVQAGAGPRCLQGRRVVQLSLSNIAAQFKEKQQAADFARDLFTQLGQDGVVVFIRDVHIAYSLDWEPILYRFLVQSGLPLLGEGTTAGVNDMIEYSSDLAEHLVAIPVEEPRGDRLARIVRQWCADTGTRTGRVVAEDAQRVAVELCGRFMGDRPFPRKVLDLLAQTRDLVVPGADGSATVGVADVVGRFSATTRVPSRLVDPAVPLDLDEMRGFLAQRLLGQDEAVDAAVRMVALIKAGLTDPNRPFGVFLFVGPTGVGKTHTAQLLAEYLFGDRNRLIRVNLTDFADERGALRLFGDPEGFNLDAKIGVLAKRLRGHPFGVLLLDEFEKAPAKLHNAFMQLLDEGRYQNGLSQTVSVTSLIVIATSNAGAEVFRESGLGFRGEPDLGALNAELDRRLHRTFLFELLNRFDRVVHFNPLGRPHIRAIAERELSELLRRSGVTGRKLEVEVEAEVVEWLAAHGYHPHYGARFLRREIERHVTGALADVVVRSHPNPGARIQVSVRGERVVVRLVADPVPRVQLTVPDGDRARTRSVSQDALVAEGREWVERWTALEQESEARRAQASLLIEASHRGEFWSDAATAHDTLRRYAVLDARLQSDERLLAPARALRHALTDGPLPALTELAGLVGDAAWNYRRWLDLGSRDGPHAVWLWITYSDPLAAAPEWLAEMVEMYTAWFERKGLRAEVVAEEERGGEVVSAVFEVAGPGVARVCEMEHGRHRRRRADAIDRARVEVLARHASVAAPAIAVEDARRVQGRFVERRAARVHLEPTGTGRRHTFVGPDRATLLLMATDLAGVVSAPGAEMDVARTYGVTGGVVFDPRTDVTVPSLRDVLKGNLEPFLRAWEDR